MYNMTQVESAQGFASLMGAVNDLLGGYVFTILLFSIWLILFAATRGRASVEDGLLLGSFVTAIIGALFGAAGLVQWNVIIFPAVLTFAIILYKFTYRGG